MIRLTNISKVYCTNEIETQALDSVSLAIDKGEFVSIMGPSGCGKSTLLNIIGLLNTATSGVIHLNDIAIIGKTDKEVAEFRNRKIGFIFQSFHLISSLNIAENVALPLLYRKDDSAAEVKRKVKIVLEKVQLSHRMQHFPAQLSGGQCQRAAIARAIIGYPDIVLADEPTGNLDSKMGEEIMDILIQLNKEGTTIVLVTHDAKIAERGNRIISMLDGKIVREFRN